MLSTNDNICVSESLATCAARVDALRSHGHQTAALRLAVAVVRTMKQNQLVAQRRWHDSQHAMQLRSSMSSKNSSSNSSSASTPCTSRCPVSACPTSLPPPPSSSTAASTYAYSPSSCTWATHNGSSASSGNPYAGTGCGTSTTCGPGVACNGSCAGGWVGHPLDPVGCLFDTLAEASLVPDDHMPRLPAYFGEYLHEPIRAQKTDDSYLLTHYRPAMPFGNRKKYIRGSF